MYFMKYDVVLNTEGEMPKKEVRGRSAAKFISMHTRNYNSDHPNTWFFVRGVSDDSASIGAIVNGESKTKELESFANEIGLDIESIFAEEISFSKLLDMLHGSYRGDYIEDDDDFTEHFDLDLTKNMLNSLFSENVFAQASKCIVMQKAEKCIHSDSLKEELFRIYSCPKRKYHFGHPVHYLIETDDRNWRKETLQTLLQALYNQGRILNKRYCFMNLNSDISYSENELDAVYKMNNGGTVVVRFEIDDHDSGDIISPYPNEDIFESVCNVVKNHRNDVLTIFELPCENKSYKDTLFDYIADITFVEIHESLFSGENARDFLKKSAKKARINTDNTLIQSIDDKSDYYAYELNNIFNDWYSKNLKTAVYPAYQNLYSVIKSKEITKPIGSAIDELNEMIGLGNAKKVIKQALDYFKVQQLFENKSIVSDRPAMHMIFTGNPGTAKTSVARLFAKIMKENGLVSKGHMVEVGRADLVGRYVGWTAQMVKKKFAEAIGGVLFVDEAYSLATKNGGSFGQEAIDTIVQEMENHRDDVVTIFAGYPNEMERFLETNPGLRSRIAFHIHFDDYSSDELCSIACLIAKKKGLVVDEGALEKLKTHFETARQNSDFGNGRYARNLIEIAKMTQASRLVARDLNSLTEKDIHTIVADDIVFTEESKVNTKRKIGFCQ